MLPYRRHCGQHSLSSAMLSTRRPFRSTRACCRATLNCCRVTLLFSSATGKITPTNRHKRHHPRHACACFFRVAYANQRRHATMHMMRWGHIHTCTCIKSSPTRGRRWSACPYRNAVLTPLRNGCGCRCWSRREVPLVQVPANGHSFQFFLRVLPPALLDRKPDRLAICVTLKQQYARTRDTAT